MNRPKLPPGQQLVAHSKWPFVGEREPRKSDLPWTLELAGEVKNPRKLNLEELNGLDSKSLTLDIHCVTRWSRFDVQFRGVTLESLCQLANVGPNCEFVSFVARSDRNHSTSLRLSEALDLQCLIAYEVDGKPLPTEHGGPIRSIVPQRYFYKSVKWLEKIEFMNEDRLGYWEAEAGYHNNADPWREERFMAPTLNKRQAKELIDARDFRNHDLRSIDASKRELEGLQAQEALLRNADFRESRLANSNFAGANLSNARFNGCDLTNANFAGSDLEGADFSRADLRGANLSDSSLFGASFCVDKNSDGGFNHGATIDQSTQIPSQAEEFLTPLQWEFLLARSPNLV